MTDQGEQWFPLRYHNEYSLEDHLEDTGKIERLCAGRAT